MGRTIADESPLWQGWKEGEQQDELCVSDVPWLSDQACKPEQSSSMLRIPKGIWPGEVHAPRDRVISPPPPPGKSCTAKLLPACLSCSCAAVSTSLHPRR